MLTQPTVINLFLCDTNPLGQHVLIGSSPVMVICVLHSKDQEVVRPTTKRFVREKSAGGKVFPTALRQF